MGKGDEEIDIGCGGVSVGLVDAVGCVEVGGVVSKSGVSVGLVAFDEEVRLR